MNNPKVKEDVELSRHPSVFRDGNYIYFFSEVNGESVCEAIRQFQYLDKCKKVKDIFLVICSGGGGIYDGFALYDYIRQCKCNIVTIGTGIVGSMALLIFLAGDKRLCTKNTIFLNHQAKTEFSGRTTDVDIERKEMQRIEEIWITIMAEHTLLMPKTLKNDTKAGDKYIGAEDALKMGIVHEIINEAKK